jgi:site-specific DNA-cytosine methylase
MKNKTFNWGTIVPLIGGMTVAGKQVTGEDPSFLLTYKAFADNEKNIRNYMPDVPYEVLDDGGNQSAGAGADFISALCPCAGLSTLGTGSAEMRESANSWMFTSTEHVLGNLKPRVLFGENAPGMYSTKGDSVRERLVALGKKHGYTMSYYFTSTHLHGVPQRRHRTFYFFWREDGRVPILPYYKKEAPTWGEYLLQVPTDATQHEDDKEKAFKRLRMTRFAKWAQAVYGDAFPDVIRARMRELNKSMWTIQDYILRDPGFPNRIEEMQKWFADAVDEKGVKYVQRIVGKVLEDKGVWDDSPAIFLPETKFNALIGRTTDSAHPYEHRALTVRECMHMMALPHDFQLVTRTINHVCQNVPVCTAADMQRSVIAYLEGKLPFVDGETAYQSNFKEAVERLEGDSKLLVF